MLFVAAAGNGNILGQGINIDRELFYPASYDLDNIISVAAIDSGDNLASFSNRGVEAVDLGAPGVAVFSTVLGDGYASYSGTSMAAPHVTGTAALALGLHPDWDFARLKRQILATTRAIPALAGNVLTGGALNADAALNVSDPGPVPTPAPTPVAPTPTPLAPFYSYALNDLPSEGRVQGSYQDTWTADGVAESITERSTTGQPNTRYDQLEHVWQFGIPGGRPTIVFRATAWSPVSSDGDAMIFDYSTDRLRWTEMFQVYAVTRTSAIQEYVLPAAVGGKYVYIRVRDTNRTPPSWKSADTVHVDAMSIRSTAQ
jgi:hypothetical protein